MHRISPLFQKNFKPVAAICLIFKPHQNNFQPRNEVVSHEISSNMLLHFVFLEISSNFG